MTCFEVLFKSLPSLVVQKAVWGNCGSINDTGPMLIMVHPKVVDTYLYIYGKTQFRNHPKNWTKESFLEFHMPKGFFRPQLSSNPNNGFLCV